MYFKVNISPHVYIGKHFTTFYIGKYCTMKVRHKVRVISSHLVYIIQVADTL